MRALFVTLLHVVGLAVGNALGDPEVKAALEGKGLSLGLLSEGNKLSKKVQDAAVAKETAVGFLKTLGIALKALFTSIREEVSHLRYAIKTALRKRPDLLLKVGIVVRSRRKKGSQPETAGANTQEASTQASTASQPAQEATSEAGSSSNAEDKQPRRHPGLNRIDRLLAGGRTILQGALEEPEILSALKPFGYTKDALNGLLGQLSDLENKQLEQKAAKGAKQTATKELLDAGHALRDWFSPWRKRISAALKGQPELRVRVGLPPHTGRKRATKEGVAQGAATTEHGATQHGGHVTEPAAQPTAVAEPSVVTPPVVTPPSNDATTK